MYLNLFAILAVLLPGLKLSFIAAAGGPNRDNQPKEAS
jgi:hypothetical protein